MVDLTVKPFKPDTPNYKVLNAIRHEMLPEYQSRIPKATQADIQASMKAITKYTPIYNEFVNTIINKVGLTIAKNRNWTNPLAIFKRGMLEFGDTIEEIQTGLTEAYVYDPDRDYGEKAIWAAERPEVQTSYHTINRENFYKITVKRVLLLRAFQSETGLATFINSLMDVPTTSDNWDEYLAMRQVLAEYEVNGGFYKVNIPEIPNDGEAGVESRQALRKVRAFSGKLRFLSRKYNAAHMPVHAEEADLILITTPDFQAALDVEALAAAFNVSYAEISSRIVIVDEFPEPLRSDGVQAILTTSDFFVVADTYYDTTLAENPVALHTNYFLHHHQIISASRFVPAIAFTYGEGTEVTEIETPVTGVNDIVVTDATGATVTDLERGQSYEVAAWAITTPTGGVNDASVLSVQSGTTGVAKSAHTYVTQTGVLHVSIDEEATQLILGVRTADLSDGPFEKSLTVDVIGDRLILWPDPEVVEDSDNDGLGEVTPETPAREGNVITIPTVTGVQYRKAGVNVNNGTEHTIAATTAFTAVARTNYELATGATASWSFDPE